MLDVIVIVHKLGVSLLLYNTAKWQFNVVILTHCP